jgi:lipopolysaccharide/colanic/teichoic acid biosynthesis glycosyltransferase
MFAQSARENSSTSQALGICVHRVMDEGTFRQVLSVERKRTERSGRPFVLMLLDCGSELLADASASILKRVARQILSVTRDTDCVGWYSVRSELGVIFTDVAEENWEAIRAAIQKRISTVAENGIKPAERKCINVSFHMFPENRSNRNGEWTRNPLLYADHVAEGKSRRLMRLLKRLVDIVVAASGLILCSPLFLIIGAAVKLSSCGPVFYRQQRIGQDGIPFVFLKFRSMHVDSDPREHKEYVHQIIAGKAEPRAHNGTSVYKLTTDPRVTRVGALLRKTSLDELPQLVNVLRGEMSLVGPRPPIAYEVEAYQLWHRRRILEAKPGITGLWQVNGRSRVKFDEMVRLDLAYAKTWSLWLDIKILLRTPRAVLEGSH